MLEFIPKNHLYLWNSAPVPSVTQIIEEFFTPWSNDAYFAERGTFIHRAIELYLVDDLEETLLDPQIVPRLEAYKKFELETGFQAHKDRIENPLYHAKYKYAGTPDLPGVMDCKEVLIDLKSGVPTKSDPIQGAAYQELLGANLKRCDKVFDLYLSGEGTYKLVEVRNIRSHLQVFLACLTLFNYKKENGL